MIDKESLKRVLTGIKGAAKGFRKDKLSAPPMAMPPEGSDQLDPEPDPMDPNEAAEMAAGEPPEMDPSADPSADPTDPAVAAANAEKAKKLDAIRKLIGSV